MTLYTREKHNVMERRSKT